MNTTVETVTVRPEDGAGRLDRWFRRHYPALGHGRLEKLLRTGQIRVDGKRARAGDPVSPGQAIRVPPLAEPATPPPARRVRPQDEGLLRQLVLYRDASAIVLNKPAGLAVQGGTKTGRHVDGLLDTLRFDSSERPRLVHRLDKDTSGILLIARNAAAAAFFTCAFREKTTRKTYWAAVIGLPQLPQGRIDLALSKGAVDGGERVRADEDGKSAVTYYRVMDHAGDRASWLALLPITGRTHQLRAHLAHIGHPIVGDPKYFSLENWQLPGGMQNKLHLLARRIVVPHPRGGVIDATAPLPPHMQQSWNLLGLYAKRYDPIVDAPEE